MATRRLVHEDGMTAYQKYVLDPLFWQALAKAMEWKEWMYCPVCGNGTGRDSDETFEEEWKYNALRFHEINLTEGWEKAVSFLYDIISVSNK